MFFLKKFPIAIGKKRTGLWIAGYLIVVFSTHESIQNCCKGRVNMIKNGSFCSFCIFWGHCEAFSLETPQTSLEKSVQVKFFEL